jgi:hypothetical protein
MALRSSNSSGVVSELPVGKVGGRNCQVCPLCRRYDDAARQLDLPSRSADLSQLIDNFKPPTRRSRCPATPLSMTLHFTNAAARNNSIRISDFSSPLNQRDQRVERTAT